MWNKIESSVQLVEKCPVWKKVDVTEKHKTWSRKCDIQK